MTWLFLGLVLVVLVVVTLVSFRGRGVSSESIGIRNFSPNLENDKVILVRGWNEAEIQKISNDFIQTYKNDGYSEYTIESNQASASLYRLTFPQDIHPQLFTFLVNYLAYPFDVDLANRAIIIGATTTLSPDFEGIDPLLVGKKAILYVPENDQDHDVVHLQTESGVNLANSFSELKWKQVNDARLASEVRNMIQGN